MYCRGYFVSLVQTLFCVVTEPLTTGPPVQRSGVCDGSRRSVFQ
ncbi:MAG: hypothetical protein AW07_02113 [Candidatus Accumulibacter sp. SK-11]|nr:MAG: hypothetical protein AW07_02113 [Candidatus Accumulibacter sp. SK-11]